jgi:NAD(P)-dependent dehydrogenase (short-subunit alcohol dehydrogenase family)
MDLGLQGKRVLVTAGASGIGREIAIAFAAEGGRVHVCDIDSAGINALSSDQPHITSDICDVADREAVGRMMASALGHLGGLDVLVNNAGISGATAPLEELDPEAWERVLNVNLNGTFNVTRLAIPSLKRSRAGVIINMSSVAGRLGYPNRSAYATSKWGLIGLTKSLSIELGQFGIRVNAILPGPVGGARIQAVIEGRAKQSGRTLEEETAQALTHMSIKKFIDPREIAAAALFLASDAATMISGQILPIDGDTQSIAD